MRYFWLYFLYFWFSFSSFPSMKSASLPKTKIQCTLCLDGRFFLAKAYVCWNIINFSVIQNFPRDLHIIYLVQVFSKPSAIQLLHWKITGKRRIHGERWKDKRPKYWWSIKGKQLIVTWRSGFSWDMLQVVLVDETTYFRLALQIADWMILSLVSFLP